MGSILERNGRFYLKWRDATGRVRREVCVATTKREAKIRLAELELQAERRRLGLEELPTETSLSLGDLCGWWLENKCSPNSKKVQTYNLGAHIIGQLIGKTPLRAVTTELIQTYLDKRLKGGAAPGTLNKLRGTLGSVYKRARKAKLWTGVDPTKDVESYKVIKKDHITLKAHEVPVFLANTPDDWRDFCATGLWLALRKGEVCGLKKSDVDLEALTVRVARSYEYDTTKGGKVAVLPLPEPLLPYLRDAMARSPSEYVFPGPAGTMRTQDSSPHKIVRSSLNRAGLVDGYRHTCRRCVSRGVGDAAELHPDCQVRYCPVCGMKLWASPVARRMTFHDLRHTTATLLLRAGVDMHRVQRILRHANINTTLGTYGHLDVNDLRPAMEMIAPVEVKEVVNLGPREVHVQQTQSETGRNSQNKLGNSDPLNDGPYWVRTSDHCRVKVSETVKQGSPRVTNGGNPSCTAAGGGYIASPPSSNSRPHSGPERVQRLRAVRPGTVALLNVKEVARLLGVSTAAVYALVSKGALPHSRALNAVRVSAEDLEAFVRAGGSK